MQINIESLNKEVFKIALNEEIERQSFNQKMIKNQISEGIRFDGDEELIEELDRLKNHLIILYCSFHINQYLILLMKSLCFWKG